MNDDGRPDPDQLLHRLGRQEGGGGRLRIFFGMSAGVGKTYAMLRAARQRLQEGADVVVGLVETHGRSETVAMLQNLPQLPRKKIAYRGVALEELDLDGLLKRKPQLALVDELAHTNAPGSRHPKRYQDVLELLDAGIDVYTTLNVQHLESRKESVEAITGVPIRETVPDSILERAHLIELVDIAPSELLKRLREGKVYLGDKAELAARHFFQEDRLTALREIALRFTAERVDQDLQRFVEVRRSSPWRTRERLMVAISHSPFSERLIRTTRRLAYNLEAPWIAVHVDTGLLLSDEDQAQLAKNVSLARELKAEVVTTTDTDVPGALRRVARQKNATQLVVGRPTRGRWRDWWSGTVLDRLVCEIEEIDIHVIRQDEGPRRAPGWRERLHFSTGPAVYWNALCFLAGLAFLGGLLAPAAGYRAIGFLFLFAVLAVGLVTSIGPTIFVAVLSAAIWDFFFIPPHMTLSIDRPEDAIMCLTYLAVAGITGSLTSRVRTHERILREREEISNALFEISQDIANSRGQSEFLTKIGDRIGRLLDGDGGILLRGSDGNLQEPQNKPYSPILSEKEQAVAAWAFRSDKKAGWSTDTLAEAKSLYLPLSAPGGPVGVLVYRPRSGRKLRIEQENLLHTLARQLAVALERHFDEQRLRESQRLEESERLHQTLLNSISHEMRTPLTTVLGVATALNEPKAAADAAYVGTLAKELLQAGDRLNRVIENLLDMSRLNSGVLSLNLEWQDLADLVNACLERLGQNLARHRVVVDMPEGVILRLDFRLMEHALSNLLLNASLYSPPGTAVTIRAEAGETKLVLRVEDEGPGLPPDSLEKIFEKFYRVPGTPAGGTGLGLSIVRSIVEAHHGHLRAENRPGGGAAFVIELPRTPAPDIPGEG